MPPCKTLYVSDLDGTLLNKTERLSAYTCQTINTLTARGLCFSYATARSYETASKVTAGLCTPIPVIVFNGTFILENGTQRRLSENFFTEAQLQHICAVLQAHDLHPMVYSFVNGVEKFSYRVAHVTEGMRAFLNTRVDDPRNTPLENEPICRGEVFHFTCMGTEPQMRPAYELLKHDFQCLLDRDLYSGYPWFEIMPKQASKAAAALQLKKQMQCDRLVCFGDGKNDLSMFEIADECYAVANANEELKRIATAVIESNEQDGVAKWLRAHCG